MQQMIICCILGDSLMIKILNSGTIKNLFNLFHSHLLNFDTVKRRMTAVCNYYSLIINNYAKTGFAIFSQKVTSSAFVKVPQCRI